MVWAGCSEGFDGVSALGVSLDCGGSDELLSAEEAADESSPDAAPEASGISSLF